jgi:hypothetical protein
MTDIHMETPGVRGHTRSTWRDETHLRGVLLRLISEHPDASREELEALYLAKTEMVPALVEEALRRAFDNDLDQIRKPPRRRPRPSAADVEAAKAAVDETVERIKEVVLLDLVQPNGKKLRDCTGADVRAFEAQMPSWFKAIAAKVKPEEIVGEILSEAEVRKAAPKEWSVDPKEE